MAEIAITCQHRNIRWDKVSVDNLGPAQPLHHVCGVCSDCNVTIHASGMIEKVSMAGGIGVLATVLLKHWPPVSDAPPVSDILFFRNLNQLAPVPS